MEARTGLPSVSVPVLSKMMWVSPRARSRDSMSLTRMPARAAAPAPATMAVGVASPSAQGQAMTRTETALINAVSISAPARSHAAKAIMARPMTTGTNMPLIRSTNRWMAGLAAWAFSTRRITRPSVESPPTARASISMKPLTFMDPAITASAGPFAAGTLSPVMSASSTSASPRSTTPSTATRSPGRQMMTSPAFNACTGVSRSAPSDVRTCAVTGRMASSSRIARPALRRARDSMCLPTSTRVMMIAEASK